MTVIRGTWTEWETWGRAVPTPRGGKAKVCRTHAPGGGGATGRMFGHDGEFTM